MKFDFRSQSHSRAVAPRQIPREARHIPEWLKKFGIWVGITLLSLIAGSIVCAFLVMRTATWSQRSPLGIIVLSSNSGEVKKKTSIVWIDPVANKIIVAPLPDTIALSSSLYGQFPLNAAYGLFSLDHPDPKVFVHFLSRSLGIDSRELIVLDRPFDPSSVRSLFLPLLLANNPHTTLQRGDLIRLWLFSSALPTERLSVQAPPASAFLSDPEAPDMQMFDRVTYDKWAERYFVNSAIKKEALTIAVVNASGKQRAATVTGRFLANLGCVLISVGDTDQLVEQGKIVVSRKEMRSSTTFAVVSEYGPSQVEENSTVASQYRADIVVIIGTQDAKDLTL